ncbi:zinc finger and BTB domain-containing protein 24 [Elysia marginata]|uniref:Zinc finger and BTB domain-containing protein 24 n=1 Tax=Elysia marginata TaxID=1093978 RepID=A0AAV4FHD6_9GAST|nr:zinc finger and BTB domain-containing protein 24 [Elysia marginata]
MAQSIITTNGSFYDPQLKKQTLLALNEQRDMAQFCDVILKVCGTQIFAHSNVLAAASPYFGSFIGTGADFPRVFSQKVPQIIEIHIDTKDGDDGYGEAVRKVIEYMYTSHITLTASLIGQIVEISRIMQMETLLVYCRLFQKGETSNYPRDACTCTSGLEDYILLMGGRSKTKKRIDVATETDDSIFEKTRYYNNNDDTPQFSETSKVNKKENESLALYQNKLVTLEKETAKDLDQPFNVSLPNQSEVSLLLEISKDRPTTHNSIEKEKSGQDEEFAERICNMNQKSQDEALKNVSAMAGVTSIVDDKSEDHDVTKGQSVLRTPQISGVTNNQALQTIVALADANNINLEEISDLVKFGDSTGQAKESYQAAPTRRPRGRPRGRGKMRGRGRGGRPRKVLKEDQNSDTEFDDFMKRLEKGDDVSAEVESKNSPTPRQADDGQMVTESESENKNLNSAKQWTTGRKRSRPPQLREDYVMHPVGKRSHNTKIINTPIETKEKNALKLNLKFVCQNCEFATSVFKEYQQHLKKHPETDPRKYKCDREGCHFRTTRVKELNAHKHQHMAEDLVCYICHERFNTKEDFEVHCKKHEGEHPYFCKECDSRFKTKAQLLAHKPKHQLEKPFVCAICCTGFKWKHALKNHMVTHSATKDHLCDECGFATAHKSQLKAHMLTHTGFMFRCPQPGCKFQATKRQNLKYHMVTHTQEKPHQCEVCGQSFSLMKNMRRHMLLHTGTRPYSCNLCGFSTTRFDKLKEHNQKLHSVMESGFTKATNSSITEGAATPSVGTTELVITNHDLSHSALEPHSHTDVHFVSVENVRSIRVVNDEDLPTHSALEPHTHSDVNFVSTEDVHSFKVITNEDLSTQSAPEPDTNSHTDVNFISAGDVHSVRVVSNEDLPSHSAPRPHTHTDVNFVCAEDIHSIRVVSNEDLASHSAAPEPHTHSDVTFNSSEDVIVKSARVITINEELSPPAVPELHTHSDVNLVSSAGAVHNIKVVASSEQDAIGSIKQEALHTIVQLADREDLAETTIMHQQTNDGNIYPIITHVELFEDADGVKYKLVH